MKTNILFTVLTLLAGSLMAADSNPKDDVTKAANKLGDQPNYSWTQTVVVPDSSQFKPGPTEGKTEKNGHTLVSWSFNDSATQGVIKGDKAVASDQAGGWQTLAELESDEGFGRFTAMTLRNIKTPAVQATNLAAFVKEWKKEGDTLSGDLTDEGAKAQLRFSPDITSTDAKASVKFWLKDGNLTKYEFKAKGKLDFNGNEIEVDNTTTVEIKDVGTTKVTVPEDARKKLS